MIQLCGRCGYPTMPAARLRSKFTSCYYCSDLDQCARRASNDLTLEEMSVIGSNARNALTAL